MTNAGRHAAARKLGVKIAKYDAQLAAGLLWCSACRRWLDREEFTPSERRTPRHGSRCRACKARYNRLYQARLRDQRQDSR